MHHYFVARINHQILPEVTIPKAHSDGAVHCIAMENSEMNRGGFIVTVVTAGLLLSAAVVLFADHIPGFSPGPYQGKYIRPFIPQQGMGYGMPTYIPDPNIDYKILRVKVDNSIDYKILVIPPPSKYNVFNLDMRKPPLFRHQLFYPAPEDPSFGTMSPMYPVPGGDIFPEDAFEWPETDRKD